MSETSERPTAREAFCYVVYSDDWNLVDAIALDDVDKDFKALAELGYAVVSVHPDDLDRAVDVACGEGYKYADTNRQRCEAAIRAALQVLGVEVSR